ncbi:hypothetical protein AB1Y20_009837 [Prymnesium parvum]|uniref:Transmembrane BAX inhibitor motif-containing protein 4 n=1 Tax=Prymnesium parvum TaxID=97485 RepID=A0AB34K1J6_PRYPA
MSIRLPLLGLLLRWVDAEVIIFEVAPSPPPPPLSDAVADWKPLYFFLGVFGLYTLAMSIVLLFDSCKPRAGSRESLPLTSKTQESGGRPRSWMALRQAGVEPLPLDAIDNQLKKGFVRKVYSILATQLLLTIGICVGMIYASFYHGDANYILHFGYYYVRQQWIVLVPLIIMICLLCALFSLKNHHPYNLILLFLFTGCLSFLLGRLIVVYYAVGSGQNILLAFTVTSATFIGLTCITLISPVDWNFLQPFLFTSALLLLFWAIFLPIFYCCGQHANGWSLFFGIVGTIMFSGFIIYDTNNIMRYLGIDDYIVACVELYLDVINLFMCVLCIFQGSN